jgi:hypothetical protein
VTGLSLYWGHGAARIPLGAPDLIEGFHDVEPGPLRWTNGDATLPLAKFVNGAGHVTLVVEGHGMPFYADGRAANADAHLMEAFENLGADCEFGFVQRHFGGEPMSLLRWAGTDPDRLRAALDARFQGLGDPRFAQLVWLDHVNEYRLRDDRFMSAHTFAGERCVDPAEEEQLRRRGCARWRLMARKLLQDIREGERIFVFATLDPRFDASGQARLAASFRAIGPAPLLFVVGSDTLAQVGHVEMIGDRVALGRIDRFVGSVGPYDTWRTLCLRAHDLLGSG